MKKIRSLAIAGLFVLSIASVNASTIVEKFATNPMLDGWQIFGDTNLFQWDSTNQNLDVTWDSTQPNSYFYLPLGKTLTVADSFCVQFDLQLSNAVAYGYGQELAIGLLHWSDATNADFSRTIDYPPNISPNVFEFDYFPAFNYGGYSLPDTTSATIVDGAANYNYGSDAQSLVPGVTYHVVLLHYANSINISAVIYTNGQVMTTFPEGGNYYPTNDDGSFVFDTISVTSYADDGFGDDIFAQGTVDNLAVASPLPVDKISTSAVGQIQFTSDTNWIYTLQRSADLQTWTCVSNAISISGNGTNLFLQDTNVISDKSFYRVRADLP
jgi:hypothetical protein